MSVPNPPAQSSVDSSATMRIGFVGIGNHALESLIPAIRNIEHVELVALADVDEEKVRAVAARIGVPLSFTSPKEMLREEQLDAVFAACPPQSHEEVARAAIEAGTPVFVEKPPASSTLELELLVDQAGDLQTGVGMNFRYATAIRHIKALLETGAYGTPVRIVAHHLANKPRSGGLWGFDETKAILMAQLIHPIDLLLSFMSSEPTEVRTSTTGGGSAGRTLSLHMTSDTDQSVSLVSGTASDKFYFRLELVTDAGALISCDNLWNVSVSGVAETDAPLSLVWERRWTPSPLDRGYVRTGYQTEMHEFLNAVRAGFAFSPSLRDLLSTYRVMDAFINTTAEEQAQ